MPTLTLILPLPLPLPLTLTLTLPLPLTQVWRIDPAKHKPGSVEHSVGWPADNNTYATTGLGLGSGLGLGLGLGSAGPLTTTRTPHLG